MTFRREYEITWEFLTRWVYAHNAEQAARIAVRRWKMAERLEGDHVALHFLTVKSPTGRSTTRWAVELTADKMAVWRIGNESV